MRRPGSPARQTSARAYKDAIRQAVTPKDIELLMRKLMVLGLQGDVAAAKVVLERVLGKAPQHIHLEGELDVDVQGAVLEDLSQESRGQLREIIKRERARMIEDATAPRSN